MANRKKSSRSSPAIFWKQTILWGVALGALLGLVAGTLGFLQGVQKFGPFALAGFAIGFIAGFLMKAIDHLPARKGTYLSKGNYMGGNRMPDVDEILESPKKR